MKEQKMYHLFFRDEKDVEKTVKKYSGKVKEQIKKAFEELKKNPVTPDCVSCSRMAHYPCYKAKVGDYRIVYDVNEEEKQIEVLMVGDRKNIYKKFKRKYK